MFKTSSVRRFWRMPCSAIRIFRCSFQLLMLSAIRIPKTTSTISPSAYFRYFEFILFFLNFLRKLIIGLLDRFADGIYTSYTFRIQHLHNYSFNSSRASISCFLNAWYAFLEILLILLCFKVTVAKSLISSFLSACAHENSYSAPDLITLKGKLVRYLKWINF